MLRSLVKKELKELLMERSILIGIIIVPLIVFPLMGALTSLGIQSTVKYTVSVKTIGFVDLDQTEITGQLLTKILSDEGLRPMNMECSEIGECAEKAENLNLKLILIIPRNFSQNITNGIRGYVETIYLPRSLSISELTACERLSTMVARALRALAEKVHGGGVNLEFFKNPATERSTIIYAKNVMSIPIRLLASTLPGIMLGLPLAAVVVASYASSVAATSIAVEKESKTLELLLTFPVRRFTILLSKLLGTFIIVVLGTISFMVGLGVYGLFLAAPYISNLETGGAGRVVLTNLPIAPSPILIAVMILSTFLAMIMTACMGLLIGVLCADVRSAQQLIGAVTFPLIMPPFFLLMFSSFEALPLGVRIGLSMDPYTHLFLSIQKGFTGEIASATASLSVMMGFTLLMLLLSSWLFMGERLVTMRLRIRKR